MLHCERQQQQPGRPPQQRPPPPPAIDGIVHPVPGARSHRRLPRQRRRRQADQQEERRSQQDDPQRAELGNFLFVGILFNQVEKPKGELAYKVYKALL